MSTTNLHPVITVCHLAPLEPTRHTRVSPTFPSPLTPHSSPPEA